MAFGTESESESLPYHMYESYGIRQVHKTPRACLPTCKLVIIIVSVAKFLENGDTECKVLVKESV